MKKRENEDLYRELTGEGRRFCAVAGLLEEAVVLALFGIRVSMSPIPVLAFLWVLFAILTAAALIGAAWMLDRIGNLRAAFGPGRASGKSDGVRGQARVSAVELGVIREERKLAA